MGKAEIKTTWLPIIFIIYVVSCDYAFLWILKQKVTKNYFGKGNMNNDEALNLAKINAESDNRII